MKKQLIWLCAAGFAAIAASAAPFVPSDPALVLEKLPPRSVDERDSRIAALRRALRADSGNLEAAAELAEELLARGNTLSDPRFVGQAQAVLQPWLNHPNPPARVRVLRAGAAQFLHDFEAALGDLDAVLREDPRHDGAWLQRATLLQVQGRYAEARSACARLVPLASPLIAAASAASLGGVTGAAPQSYELLEKVLDQSGGAPAAAKRWAHSILAELASALERAADAERHFRAGLALEPHHAYLLAAYSDFLFEQGRAGDVLRLLNARETPDGLLLRRALAAQRADPRGEEGARLRARLRDRFAAAAARSEPAHRREHAMFLLHLCGEPHRALEQARLNWEAQKEPLDARILLEAAVAAGSPAAARPVLEWMRANSTQHAQLEALARRFRIEQAGARGAR